MSAGATSSDDSAEPSAKRPGGGRIAFFISDGADACFAVQQAIERGELPGCSIELILCDMAGAPGAQATRAAGLRTITLEAHGRSQADHEDAIDTLLRKLGVELVLLYEYGRTLSVAFVRRWPARILRLHASLLPAFPGPYPERQAIEYGAQFTGCTIAFVDGLAEFGPVIVQRVAAIADDATEASLRAQLQTEQHKAAIEAIQRVMSGVYELKARRYLRRTLPSEPATASCAMKPTSAPSASLEPASGRAEIPSPGSAPERGPSFASVASRARRS